MNFPITPGPQAPLSTSHADSMQQAISTITSESSTPTAAVNPLQEAWAILMDEGKWKDKDEKSLVVVDEYGLSNADELPYLDEEDLQIVAGKLKTVPGKMFLKLLSSI
jgi:hypothetical protein